MCSLAWRATVRYARQRRTVGFDFTGADCGGWMRDAGFAETYVEDLTGIESMVVGLK